MRAGFKGLHCLGVIGLCLATQAWAAEPRLLIQRAQIAGFAYHAGGRLWPQLHEGDAVQLVLEGGNPHDPQAVRVDFASPGQEGGTLGYLARTENGAIARALERGQVLQARISHLRDSPNPRNRVEVEIWAPVSASK